MVAKSNPRTHILAALRHKLAKKKLKSQDLERD
jgi:hypothetical protein